MSSYLEGSLKYNNGQLGVIFIEQTEEKMDEVFLLLTEENQDVYNSSNIIDPFSIDGKPVRFNIIEIGESKEKRASLVF